jgi:signal transduction histidine kinase
VEVALTREGGWVTLDVHDRGIGFELRDARRHGGIGLASMAERARLLGGTCTIESEPSRGTRVRARLPLAGDAVAAGR